MITKTKRSPAAKKSASDLPVDVTVEQLSAIFGVTERRIFQMVKDGQISRSGRGRYNLAESVRGVVGFWQTKSESTPDPLSRRGRRGYVEEQQGRAAAALADKRELENDRSRGLYIHVDDMEKYISSVFASVRAKILAIPSRLAPFIIKLSSQRIAKQILSEQLNEVLFDLSRVDLNSIGSDS